jgi:hypothetical protein
MKSKLSAALVATWTALTCVSVVGTIPARADTTYYYTGGPYSVIETAFIGTCSFPVGCVRTPNPNADADAAKFGTNMTGFVTFNFDTSGFSGTFSRASGTIPAGVTEIRQASILSIHKRRSFPAIPSSL